MDFTILVIPYIVGRGEKVSRAGSDTKRCRVLVERLREQMQFAESVGRKARLEDAFAIGGHLVLRRTAAESKDIQAGFEELFNMA